MKKLLFIMIAVLSFTQAQTVAQLMENKINAINHKKFKDFSLSFDQSKCYISIETGAFCVLSNPILSFKESSIIAPSAVINLNKMMSRYLASQVTFNSENLPFDITFKKAKFAGNLKNKIDAIADFRSYIEPFDLQITGNFRKNKNIDFYIDIKNKAAWSGIKGKILLGKQTVVNNFKFIINDKNISKIIYTKFSKADVLNKIDTLKKKATGNKVNENILAFIENTINNPGKGYIVMSFKSSNVKYPISKFVDAYKAKNKKVLSDLISSYDIGIASGLRKH